MKGGQSADLNGSVEPLRLARSGDGQIDNRGAAAALAIEREV